MKLKITLAAAFSLFALGTLVYAQRGGERGGGERGGGEHGGARPMPPRPAPPRFQAHPPGQHPHGPIVRPHQVRVLAPRAVRYGAHEWRHWEHPEFARPHYYWEWANVHQVSCTSEDSYGDQYVVNEQTFPGFELGNMTAVEDDALDRCYNESGNDASCYLASCTNY